MKRAVFLLIFLCVGVPANCGERSRILQNCVLEPDCCLPAGDVPADIKYSYKKNEIEYRKLTARYGDLKQTGKHSKGRYQRERTGNKIRITVSNAGNSDVYSFDFDVYKHYFEYKNNADFEIWLFAVMAVTVDNTASYPNVRQMIFKKYKEFYKKVYDI